MKMDEAQAGRLLALYASGQLRTAEKTQLFAAALENQELFDALAHEDAMRDVLELPGAKDRLVASLTPQRKNQWFAWAGGLAAVAAALVVVIAIRNRPSLPPAESIEVVGQSEPAQAPVSTARIRPKKAEVASDAAPQSAAAPRAKLAKAYSGPGKAAPKEEAPQSKLAVLADKVEPRDEVLVEKREVRASPMAAPASLPNSARSNVIASEDAIAIVASTPAYRISRRGGDGVFSALAPGQTLLRGDVVRLNILAQFTGNMTVEFGGQSETMPVIMGAEYLAPRTSQIVLDQPSGETVIRISYPSGMAMGLIAQKDNAAPATPPALPVLAIRLKYE